ncbi:MAG: hypothetical protein JXP73_01465 [Deltaproteobacteria bacterium]|nr:hypothetical protein [Deltaproteobacteria bacterium]
MLGKALSAGFGLATLLLFGTHVLAGAPRFVRLDYERQAGAASCPEEAVIRAGVAARLGYEPFRERARDRLRATIRQAGQGLEASIELFDARGNLKAARRLTSRNRECSELASSVELAIAIAIDPMGSPVPAEVAAAPEGGGAAAPAPGRQAAADESQALGPGPAPEGRPLSWRAQVGAVGGWGAAPSFGIGFAAGGALEGERWSVGIEGRVDLPSAMSLRVGEASAGLLVASLVPCLRLGAASACALATGGARQVAGDGLDHARHATVPYLAFGGRLAAALPVSQRAALALHGDISAPVTKIRLKVDDEVVWTSPAVAVALGLGIALAFP